MTIQSAIAAELPFLRAEANAMMQDTFTPYASTRVKVDGLNQDVWAQAGDPTPGKVPNRVSGADASNARTVTVGGVERVVVEQGLHLPWDQSPAVGLVYVCTALGPTSPPVMLGKAYRVVETHPTSAMTAWRLDVVVEEGFEVP